MRRLVAGLLAVGVAHAAWAADVPPRRKGALLRWLAEGTYRMTFVGEPAVHPSMTAHGANVHTYYNDVLVEDLREGRITFRRGASMVKELYFSGTETVVGWAVMRKVRGSAGRTGRGWLFYETLDGTNEGAFFGRGKPVCTGCHAGGVDYLLSPFRPE
jgi:hypothetical protein